MACQMAAPPGVAALGLLTKCLGLQVRLRCGSLAVEWVVSDTVIESVFVTMPAAWVYAISLELEVLLHHAQLMSR